MRKPLPFTFSTVRSTFKDPLRFKQTASPAQKDLLARLIVTAHEAGADFRWELEPTTLTSWSASLLIKRAYEAIDAVQTRP